MKSVTLITAVSMLVATSFTLRESSPSREVAALPAHHAEDPSTSALVTLRSVDDLTATIGFPAGAHGYVVEESQLRNRVSHLSFDRWVKDSLVVGIQGGSVGVIKDLGDLRTRETSASVLPFLELRDGVVFDAGRERSNVPEGGVALQDKAQSVAAAKVQLGHIYLIRIDEPNTSLFVAARVVEHVPGQSVTLRWRML